MNVICMYVNTMSVCTCIEVCIHHTCGDLAINYLYVAVRIMIIDACIVSL
jgi:hypothetical protein